VKIEEVKIAVVKIAAEIFPGLKAGPNQSQRRYCRLKAHVM
jgi:hypothetical protein